MPRTVNIGGRRFGRLVAVMDIGSRSGRRLWLAQCDCGRQTEATAHNMKSGTTRSCGCLQRERAAATHTTHGHTRGHDLSPSWTSWQSMIQRCTNRNGHAWDAYGGRGISVCQRWLDSFEDFLVDVGERPSLALSLDRYPNKDGNYEPGNVRWATREEQSRNRSSVKLSLESVSAIRRDFAAGASKRSLASRHGITRASVAAVVNNEIWRGL